MEIVFFVKLLIKKSLATKIYEDEKVYAFLDISQANERPHISCAKKTCK